MYDCKGNVTADGSQDRLGGKRPKSLGQKGRNISHKLPVVGLPTSYPNPHILAESQTALHTNF